MTEDVIGYWVDLINDELKIFKDKRSTKAQLKELKEKGLLNIVSIDNTGVFAYLIVEDIKGMRIFSEMIFYIKPEFRGSLSLVKKYIEKAEGIALENSCKRIVIGGNVGYKDKAYLKLLKRWGYIDSAVTKII